MKTTITKEVILLTLSLIPAIFLGLVWNEVPETVATHWNMYGKADGFSAKGSLIYIVLGLPLGIYFSLLFAPKLDPKGENYAIFGETYFRLRMILTLFMVFIMLLMIYGGIHPEYMLTSKWVLSGVSLLLSGIGNYMPTIKPNWFVGIRTPWTLSDEDVWRKTHQLGGKIWFWGGIVSALIVAILPEDYSFYGFMGIILLLALFPIIYSYQISNKTKK